MYANVRKASRRWGVETSARMSACASSISVTIEPIGSSTSGTQMSSRFDTGLKYGLGPPAPPSDIGRDGEDEGGEQASKRRLGERRRELDSPFHPRNRGEPDDERR